MDCSPSFGASTQNKLLQEGSLSSATSLQPSYNLAVSPLPLTNAELNIPVPNYKHPIGSSNLTSSVLGKPPLLSNSLLSSSANQKRYSDA